jgi:hypothetical protein
MNIKFAILKSNPQFILRTIKTERVFHGIMGMVPANKIFDYQDYNEKEN